MDKIRVLIADDHAIMREGIRALLALSDNVEVVGEATESSIHTMGEPRSQILRYTRSGVHSTGRALC